MLELLSDTRRLVPHIVRALGARSANTAIYDAAAADLAATSAVLLLVGRCRSADSRTGEVCLILNKRSARVRQPGDLCCPGGSVSPRVDFMAARLLGLPFSPLWRWPGWRSWRRQRPLEARWLALYLATGLREAFEEMRLNPLRLKFLGPLPHHRLVLFRRLIYPLTAWVSGRARFRPNWEVDSIVWIPLRRLLDPAGYVCYRLQMSWGGTTGAGPEERDHPGFQYTTPDGPELLWGATYRIVAMFLETVFAFTPPALESLAVVDGNLGEAYLTGAGC
jgi:hypothetical protein